MSEKTKFWVLLVLLGLSIALLMYLNHGASEVLVGN
jgi:hypothetical protein